MNLTDDDDLPPDPPESMRKVPLSLREVTLLLRYSYPFEEVEEQLEAFKAQGGNSHVLNIHTMEISMLIGDLVYSSKSLRSDRLLQEFDALCSQLEAAENGVIHRGYID